MENTAEKFADTVGRKKIADAVGVGLTAVSNCVVRGRFSSAWHEACRQLATSAGVDCPPELFGQKGIPQTPEGAE
ncbi:MAG: hypothetical protein ACRBB0_15320 [Pelagimonas sp.]|uniref:hypothetical protein n=1 Tax=Pelagimonas sp. TaxID=2073170 RepID=UPI003D6AEB6C